MKIEQCSGTTTRVVEVKGSVSLIANYSFRNDTSNPMLTLILIMTFLNFTDFLLDVLYKGFLIYILYIYEGWNFNSGNHLFTTDTK